MSWNIVLDSSCDLMPSKHSFKNAELKIAPLTIRVGDIEFVDDHIKCKDVDAEEMRAGDDIGGKRSLPSHHLGKEQRDKDIDAIREPFTFKEIKRNGCRDGRHNVADEPDK